MLFALDTTAEHYTRLQYTDLHHEENTATFFLYTVNQFSYTSR